MANKNVFYVGMPIRFPRAYSSDPKKRLKGSSGKEAVPLYDLDTDEVTPASAGQGIVIGQRNYIMSNWIRDCYVEEGYRIDGKKRAMLLVSVGFTRAFVLVKHEDAELAYFDSKGNSISNNALARCKDTGRAN